MVVLVRIEQTDELAAGVEITFAANLGNGAPSPKTVVTDANGLAATAWTLGSSVGVDTLWVIAAFTDPVRVLGTAH